MISMSFHMYAEQTTVFEVWVKESHGPPFREEKKNFYQLRGALYDNLKR